MVSCSSQAINSKPAGGKSQSPSTCQKHLAENTTAMSNTTWKVPTIASFFSPYSIWGCYGVLSVLKLKILISPVQKSQSTVAAPGFPAGTCAGRHGWWVLKSWCTSSPPGPPGCPGTALSCSLQPECESHCGVGGCLQEQRACMFILTLRSFCIEHHIWFLNMQLCVICVCLTQ